MATAHQKMPPSVRSTVAAAPRDHEPLGACMNSTRGGRMGWEGVRLERRRPRRLGLVGRRLGRRVTEVRRKCRSRSCERRWD